MEDLERVVMGSPQRFATPEGRRRRSAATSSSAPPTRARCSTSSTTSPSRRSPALIEAYLATAELALAKQDYALAAETLRKAPKAAAEDPRFHYLLACALFLRGPARLRQGAGRGPQDQPEPR